jgi:hypothetical protein
MKAFFLSALVCAAAVSSAADLTLSIDTKAPARQAFPHGAPCVGYAADPQAGGEEAAIACRRAGAWLFRTALCDDATLAFCAQYGLRLFVVLDGDQKEVIATLNRLAQSPHKEVVAGLQLGADPAGGADPSMWRKLAAHAARQLPNIPIALPVKDLESPLFVAMGGSMGPVTHLIVDLRDAPAPYEKLERIAGKLRKAPDKSVERLRRWAVGPGRLPGATDEEAAASPALAWQIHWIMSALAVDRTDGVFIERPCRADDFGLAMRHLWAATTGNRSLIGHGEGASSSEAPKAAPKAPAADMELDGDLGMDAIELSDAWTPGPAPVACANVAAGKPGDVEYLVLLAPPVDNDGQRVCLFVVNTAAERVTIHLDVNKSGGNVTSGWRRRLVPDAEKGAMRNSTRERSGKPFAEVVEPGEITFMDFRI